MRRAGPLALLLPLLACGADPPPATDAPRVAAEGLAYGPRADHRLDVLLPGAGHAPPFPVLVVAHGGGFFSGTRRLDPAVGMARGILDAGVALVPVTYGLAPEHLYPVPEEDVARAVQWVRVHGADHDLDPTRVGGLGQSAGAVLLGLTTYGPDRADPGADDPVARASSRTDCLVGFGGPAIWTAWTGGYDGTHFGVDHVRDVPRELLVEASAVHHLRRWTTPPPPAFLRYTGPVGEEPTPHSHDGLFVERLAAELRARRAAGVVVEWNPDPAPGEAQALADPAYAEALGRRVGAWVQATLR